MSPNDALAINLSKGLFLQWQLDYLADKNPIKLLEKSRRIGGTWIQAYEDVIDCLKKVGHGGKAFNVWFTSADETAAKEYINYIREWCEYFQAGAEVIQEQLIDLKKDVTALTVKFKNGNKIHALSSNPKAMRSKGGKVVIDEFAHHDNDGEMWRAAEPTSTWGYDIRILSTHNGKNCLFYQFIQDIKTGVKGWGLHTVDIYTAVKQGLLCKILGRPSTEEEQEEWLLKKRQNCGGELNWQQEYCCVASDENSVHLSYELLRSCTRADINMKYIVINSTDFKDYSAEQKEKLIDEYIAEVKLQLANCKAIYVGMDIGRKNDISCIWAVDKVGDVKTTKLVIDLDKIEFSDQRRILYAILELPQTIRTHIDATGIGAQLAEEAKQKFGTVVEVWFTAAIKERMATIIKTNFEDQRFFYTHHNVITEDLHSIKRKAGTRNNIYETPRAGNTSHGDRFWACALALDCSVPTGSETIPNPPRPKEQNMVNKFTGFVSGKISRKMSRY